MKFARQLIEGLLIIALGFSMVVLAALILTVGAPRFAAVIGLMTVSLVEGVTMTDYWRRWYLSDALNRAKTLRDFKVASPERFEKL